MYNTYIVGYLLNLSDYVLMIVYIYIYIYIYIYTLNIIPELF